LIDLEKLYLDRTLLTDDGLEKLKPLAKLETLSLCRTKVSNNMVRLLGDFEQTSFARNLRTLNLAQCNLVSDKGVRGLAGMINLTHLNLDHTSVSKSCIRHLKGIIYMV
jgi:Leucine-rich repeat (LRR) protein